MRIKSFIASTVQEALKSVKREMGDASIILETRNIEEGDIKSKAGQTLVEVVAAENSNRQNTCQDEEQKEQKEEQEVQDDSADLNLQSSDQDQPDTSQPDQQQLEEKPPFMEHKGVPDDHIDKVTLSDHLHSNNRAGQEESTLKNRLGSKSDMNQAGKVKQISKLEVGRKVKNSFPHVRRDIRDDSDNSKILSSALNQSGSSPSTWHPSEKYSSANKQKNSPRTLTGNVKLSDHLVAEDLIKIAGCSADEKTVPVVSFQNLASNIEWSEAGEKLFRQLLLQQVEKEHSRLLIDDVLSRLSKDEYGRMDLHSQMLRKIIINRIKISDSDLNNQDECKTMVFVGAAGTGKTTTILKMASNMKKQSDKEILLISIRGHSAERLKKAAGRIGANLRTVTSHRELRSIIDKYEGSSHIFIDTPGISYLDDNALSELKGYLDEMPNMETHLVVSATTRYADIINIINKFKMFPVHKLHFTKVDETCLHGTLFSVAMETQIPLSCISDGQEIPEDIRPITAKMVADMVLQV